MFCVVFQSCGPNLNTEQLLNNMYNNTTIQLVNVPVDPVDLSQSVDNIAVPDFTGL